MEEMPIIPIYTYTSKHLIHSQRRGAALQPDGFPELEIRDAGARPHVAEALR
ncbi:MAG: hypothetical protein CM15mP74_05450 [Halieaceae bacterium]|nr:MAG: hypothetical protein CM15mP74_05450 [Halieaceae bacterium]